MNLSELTDHQKSVLLAKAVGWRVRQVTRNPVAVMLHGEEPDLFDVFDVPYPDGYITERYDLYEPEDMHLAWLVLNWAARRIPFIYEWWEEDMDVLEESPAVAQRLWLDKIVELAAGVGIIEGD